MIDVIITIIKVIITIIKVIITNRLDNYNEAFLMGYAAIVKPRIYRNWIKQNMCNCRNTHEIELFLHIIFKNTCSKTYVLQ
jgi:hypothetical protein